jgi:hypothetical protein
MPRRAAPTGPLFSRRCWGCWCLYSYPEGVAGVRKPAPHGSVCPRCHLTVEIQAKLIDLAAEALRGRAPAWFRPQGFTTQRLAGACYARARQPGTERAER